MQTDHISFSNLLCARILTEAACLSHHWLSKEKTLWPYPREGGHHGSSSLMGYYIML